MKPEHRLWLWLLAVPAAWICTAGSQACDPVPLLIAPLVLLALPLLLVGCEDRRWRWALGLGLLLLTFVPITRTLYFDGFPKTHDMRVHLWAVWGFGRALAGGELLPQWIDVQGLGMPIGRFYPPLPYLLGGILHVIGLDSAGVTATVDWASGVLAVAMMVLVCRDSGLSWRTTVAACALVLFAPYRLLDVNYRFALGEMFGIALLPPLWHFGLRVALDRPGQWIKRPAVALCVISVVLALTHPLSAIMALFGTLFIAVTALTMFRPAVATVGRGLGRIAVVGLLTAGISAFHVLPSAAETEDVRIGAVIPHSAPAYQAKALHVAQTFERRRYDGNRLAFTLAAEKKRLAQGLSIVEVPHYLGWTLGLPMFAALFWRRKHEFDGDAKVYAAAAVACWAATLPLPALAMGTVPVFHGIQFPWRFLGPASMAAVLAAAYWLEPVLKSAKWGHAAVLLVALGVIFDGWPGLGAGSWTGETEAPTGDEILMHWQTRGAATCNPEAKIHANTGSPIRLDELSGKPQRKDMAPGGPIVDAPDAPWAGYPTGDRVSRLVGLYLPPQDLDTDVALTYRVQPEFWTRQTALSFAKGGRERDPKVLSDAGVDLILPTFERQQSRPLEPWPRVRLLTKNKRYGLAAHVTRKSPSFITLDLPDGHPGGRLVMVEQFNIGWQAKVDDEPWMTAKNNRGLLAVGVKRGAKQVRFRYGAHTPIRKAGLATSALSLLIGLALLLWPYRRRSS